MSTMAPDVSSPIRVLGTDAGERVEIQSRSAGLLLPDREQRELSTGAPVVQSVLDGDRDEIERRDRTRRYSVATGTGRGEARQSLRPVDDAGYPIERDDLRVVSESRTSASSPAHALPPAIQWTERQ